MNTLPATAACLRVNRQNFAENFIDGEVSAGGFEWNFHWEFSHGELQIEPSLGRALIQDALLRFLVKMDYQLEPGENYFFTVRAKF